MSDQRSAIRERGNPQSPSVVFTNPQSPIAVRGSPPPSLLLLLILLMAANAHLGAPKLGMLPMGPSGPSYAYVCASCDLGGFPATTSSGGELTTCPSCSFPLPASLQRLAAWNMIRYVLPFSCTSSRTRAAPSAVSLPDSSSKKRTRAHMSGMGMDKIPDTPPSQIVGGQQQNAQQLVASQNGQAGEQTSELETTAKAAQM